MRGVLLLLLGLIMCIPHDAYGQIEVTPSSFDFPLQPISTSSEPQDFIIRNQGTEPFFLNPGDIALAARDDQMTSLSVLTLNVWYDADDWPARFALMLQEIRDLDPDVIGLQEVIQRATLDNQAQQLADSLGYYYYFGSVDPDERDQRFGNAILSRYPIEDATFRALQPLDAYRKAVHVKVSVGGNVVDVYNTHLHNPPGAGDTRKQQITGILDFIEETNSGGIIFLTGDFNADPDWEEMELAYEAFTDVYPLFHENHLDPEHTTLNPHLGHQERRIDYIFFESSERLIPLSADIVLNEPNDEGIYPSDHFGVFATFDILGDASDFVLSGIPESVELLPGGTVTVRVAFAPGTVGSKNVILRIGDEEVNLTGEAFDATVRAFPWVEDFADADEFRLPAGWTSNVGNWHVSDSNHAGGEPPELVFWWEPVAEGMLYVRTPPFETTGLDSMHVSFRHRINGQEDPGTYILRLISIAGDQEHVILEWEDPDEIAAENVSTHISREEHGVGSDRLQLAWVFEGSSDDVLRWAIDDVRVGALPQLMVTPGAAVFDLQPVDTVSDSVLFILTNIGGGTIDFDVDAIRITGEDADHFRLDGPNEHFALGGGDSLIVRVAFAPLSTGNRTAFLTIGEVNIPLTGEGFDQSEHLERFLTLNLMRGGAEDNSEFNRIANPAPDEVNSSSEVVEFRRSRHGVPWGGFFANMPIPLDLTEYKYVYVDVLKPRLSPLRFKVENGPTANLEIESMFPQIRVGEWETIVFDFSEKSGQWNVIAFMPDFESPLTLEEDIVIYFANIRLGEEPTGTSSEDIAEMPREFGIGQNYPNPFNPVTTIHYQVPEHSHVRVDVYNVMGQLVATLVDDERAPGYHEVRFDSTLFASGVYLYRMQAGRFVETRKLSLLK